MGSPPQSLGRCSREQKSCRHQDLAWALPNISDLPQIPACLWDASQERAGSVVLRLPAGIGVGGGSSLEPVWDFHYWSSKHRHGAVQVLGSQSWRSWRAGGSPRLCPHGTACTRGLNGHHSRPVKEK